VSPWALLAGVITIGAAGSLVYLQGREDGANHVIAQQAAARSAADLKARETARQTFRAMENRDAEDLAVHARLADALERLRKRPDRVPAAAAPACEGATGAQLSGPDAGVLEREAARADLLRSALRECYGWVDAVGR